MTVSELERALKRGRVPGVDLAEALLTLGGTAVHTEAEAEAALAALVAVRPVAPTPCGAVAPAGDCPASALYLLASLLQRPGTPAVQARFARDGMACLLAQYDAHLPLPGAHQQDLLFLLKVAALYGAPGGLERTVEAARAGRWPDDTLWEVVVRQWAAGPEGERLVAALADPLPRGFAAIALLDLANERALSGAPGPHPFASAEGLARLEGWLRDPDPARASYAQSATTALALLEDPAAHERLLPLALAHASPRVALEAAWAAARLGREPRAGEGLARLVEACRAPAWAVVARSYLQELGRADAIPPEALAADAQAEAELCAWLAHPHERGAPPDAVRIVDRRRLRWPPTGDERRVWLIEYRYARGSDGAPEVGVGMVGSLPCVLFGETRPDMAPEDVYALHCCWELQVAHDPRAPKERTVEEGRRLLGG